MQLDLRRVGVFLKKDILMELKEANNEGMQETIH